MTNPTPTAPLTGPAAPAAPSAPGAPAKPALATLSRELAEALAALSVDRGTAENPLGLDAAMLAEVWEHVRFFPLTSDRLQLIEDEPGEPPSVDQMKAGRATQLWIGLARAALVSDTTD